MPSYIVEKQKSLSLEVSIGLTLCMKRVGYPRDHFVVILFPIQ